MAVESTTRPEADPLRLAIAGGGTGGHVSPALAVIEELNRRGIDFEAVWIGSIRGFEREAAASYGIPFESIPVGKLRRYISVRTIPDAIRIPAGVVTAGRILRRHNPDAIFSTGGYVSVPAVIAGRALRIPSLTHEQTAVIGLATNINARFCDTVALSYEATPHPKTRRVVVTGNPVRASLFSGSKEEAVRRFCLRGDRPLIYFTGGAQGARAINHAVEAALPELLELAEIVHQTGPNELNGCYQRLRARKAALPEQLGRRYHPVERVGSELGDLYQAARVVVGRSGAGTVAELAAFGIPSVLIPLPGAAEAWRNAELLAGTGGAVLLPQDELTASRLVAEVERLLLSKCLFDGMGAAVRGIAPENAAGRLVEELLALAEGRSPSDTVP